MSNDSPSVQRTLRDEFAGGVVGLRLKGVVQLERGLTLCTSQMAFDRAVKRIRTRDGIRERHVRREVYRRVDILRRLVQHRAREPHRAAIRADIQDVIQRALPNTNTRCD